MNGELLEIQIKTFLPKLLEGEKIPQNLIDEMTGLLNKRLQKETRQEFTIRMSAIGKPLCQSQMEKLGVKKGSQPYNQIVRFVTGDMLELWLLMVMKAAGVNIQSQDKSVSVDIGGISIKGTLDVIIDDVVWDIKSASAFSFRKFQEGYKAVIENDTFGYASQGFLYSKATGLPFGGWIVINKNNGDITVCEITGDHYKLSKETLLKVEKNIESLVSNAPFKKQFTDVDELFRKKPTNNRILCITCGFCNFRDTCWPGVTYRPSVMSKAISPPYFYYTEINTVLEN